MHRLRLAEMMSYDFPYRFQFCRSLSNLDPGFFGEELPASLVEKYHYAFRQTADALELSPRLTRFQYLAAAGVPRLFRHPIFSSFIHIAAASKQRRGTPDLNLLVTAATNGDIQLIKSLLEMGASVDSEILCANAWSEAEMRPVWMVLLSYLAICTCTCYITNISLSASEAHLFDLLEILLLQHKNLAECVIHLSYIQPVPPSWDRFDSSFQDTPVPEDIEYFVTLEQIIQGMSPPSKDRLFSLINPAQPELFKTPFQFCVPSFPTHQG
ncbi:hypothetical protein BDW59DRAFT_158333 [Aspergillus cavernicola]|uniref:Ankyrin repeat-containing domain protein n=1 Tax=Aspergillus cavernicola TaxID=176166 RepID=A0ABR4IT38_9EURO